jgi:hypothetical protein
MVDSVELEARVRELGRVLGASKHELPTFDRPRGDGLAFIEVRGAEMHWIVDERGRELQRRTTLELDELLYWAFEAVTYQMASDWEVRHRNDDKDIHVALLNKQFELLARLSDRWVARRRADVGDILGDVDLD